MNSVEGLIFHHSALALTGGVDIGSGRWVAPLHAAYRVFKDKADLGKKLHLLDKMHSASRVVLV